MEKNNLPKGWIYVTLPDIVKNEKHAIKRGPFGSHLKKSFFVKSGYKVYEQQHAIYNDFDLGHYYINKKKFQELKAFEVNSGDLIISCSGTIGKIARVPENFQKGVINQALLKISINTNIFRILFFSYIFEFWMKRAEIESHGSGMGNLSSVKVLKEIPILLPPLNEQKRIVAKIEEVLTIIDFQFQITEKTKKLLKTYTKSILKNAFNGKLTKQWRLSNSSDDANNLLNKIEEERRTKNLENFRKTIPKTSTLPERWVITTLGFLSENYDGKRIPVSKIKRKEIQGKYPYYGASGIIDYVNKPIFKGKFLLIGEDGANLLARTTPIAFIADGEFWVNNHAHVLKTLGKIPLEFLSYYINSIDLSEWVTGTAQPKLNQSNMNKIQIPIPSINEQKEIVRILEYEFSSVIKQMKLIERLEKFLYSLKSSTLKQAFEGKLVPQDPNDEPASELLKRIKSK